MSVIVQIFQGFGTKGSAIAPVANFTASPTTITSGGTVTFTDTSTNTPTSWLWTFGDGTTSTLRNPTHVYGAGVFTVSLKVTNSAGNNTKTVTNMITSNLAGNVQTITTPTTLYTISPNTITFGNGKFVAISYGIAPAKIMYSTDGINWTNSGTLYTVGNSTYIKSVAYGNGYFVADHYNDYWTYYSADGINWSAQAVSSNVGLSSNVIKAANGMYINFGSFVPRYSTDMVNWTISTNGTGSTGEYIPSANRWVTVSGTATRYSTDNGATWITGPVLPNSVPASKSATNGTNSAVFAATSAFFAQTDGTNWTTYAAPFNCTAICYGGGKFVAVSNTKLIYSSTDGINWSQIATIATAGAPTGIIYGNGKYVITSFNTATVWVLT